MKYIDADRIRAEIERQIAFLPTVGYSTQVASEFIPVQNTLNYILSFIDSLQQEQPELPGIERPEYYYHKGVYEGLSQGRADALKILDEFAKSKADPVVIIKQPDVDLEIAARHVYESWMGGTMDGVRRDMAELGKVLNARKKE